MARGAEQRVNIAWDFAWDFLPAFSQSIGFFRFFRLLSDFALARKTLMF
jgi:hypothetical protein